MRSWNERHDCWTPHFGKQSILLKGNFAIGPNEKPFPLIERRIGIPNKPSQAEELRYAMMFKNTTRAIPNTPLSLITFSTLPPRIIQASFDPWKIGGELTQPSAAYAAAASSEKHHSRPSLWLPHPPPPNHQNPNLTPQCPEPIPKTLTPSAPTATTPTAIN